MDIRKYQHACLQLTKDNQSLVIDPGGWSTDFEPNERIVGIVITHEHADHFDVQQLQKILEKNPNVYIFAHVDIIAQLGELGGQKQAVAVGDAVNCGPFSLRFVGGEHASIHPAYPVPANLGIIVDDGELYYPGDSFFLPDCDVKTLAVPASAPWMKMSEAMDFITSVKPKTCFPTHDVLLSPEGHQLTDAWLSKAAQEVGADYQQIPH